MKTTSAVHSQSGRIEFSPGEASQEIYLAKLPPALYRIDWLVRVTTETPDDPPHNVQARLFFGGSEGGESLFYDPTIAVTDSWEANGLDSGISGNLIFEPRGEPSDLVLRLAINGEFGGYLVYRLERL